MALAGGLAMALVVADVLHDVIFQIYTDDEKETVAEIKGFQ